MTERVEEWIQSRIEPQKPKGYFIQGLMDTASLAGPTNNH